MIPVAGCFAFRHQSVSVTSVPFLKRNTIPISPFRMIPRWEIRTVGTEKGSKNQRGYKVAAGSLRRQTCFIQENREEDQSSSGKYFLISIEPMINAAHMEPFERADTTAPEKREETAAIPLPTASTISQTRACLLFVKAGTPDSALWATERRKSRSARVASREITAATTPTIMTVRMIQTRERERARSAPEGSAR